MIIPEVQPLMQEKHELTVKLDKNNYDSDVDKEKDETRLGEVTLKITQITKNFLTTLKVDEVVSIKEEKLETPKQARALTNGKREIYKELAKDFLKLYNEMVAKKREGAELLEKLQGKNLEKYDFKKIMSDVRKY